MSRTSYSVNVAWDAEAAVWVATSDDVPGLVAEAATPSDMLAKLKVLVPELLDLNGALIGGARGAPVSVSTHFGPFDQELLIA